MTVSQETSSFNIYYASHLYEHINRILMQFLRSLAQEEEFEEIEIVVGSLLLVLFNHLQYDQQNIRMNDL